MGELYKTQHTIDEMLDKMGVKIVLNPEHVSEEDLLEAHKEGSSVVLKKTGTAGKDENA
ncbi:MAG: tryptophanyl-tRNA synthetase [Dialister sp.]|nr:tryptophanyl-tRNA synthetase [Dialister sp.]